MRHLEQEHQQVLQLTIMFAAEDGLSCDAVAEGGAIERFGVQRGMNLQTLVSVPRQHRPKGRRDGNSSL